MISLEDIQKIQRNKNRIKKETYLKIYDKCNKKIRTAVELNQKQVFFQIPKWIVGYPAYDLQKAGDYIQRQLENGKFIVSRISLVDIYISWNKKEQCPPDKIPLQEDDETSLTSLMNLKKMASKYK